MTTRLIRSSAGPSAHCHVMVKEFAVEAAGCLYEKVMGDNKVFEEWKRQNPDCTPKQLEERFIARNWGKCLDFARATMAAMLRGPYPEVLKDQILDALIKDGTLNRGRRNGYRRMMN